MRDAKSNHSQMDSSRVIPARQSKEDAAKRPLRANLSDRGMCARVAWVGTIMWCTRARRKGTCTWGVSKARGACQRHVGRVKGTCTWL